MGFKEKLKAFLPVSANAASSYAKSIHEQIQKLGSDFYEMSKMSQEILNKVGLKDDIPVAMKPPYYFDLRLQAIQWDNFDELETWLNTLDNVALFQLQDINTRYIPPSQEYQLFQPEFLLYHSVDEARAYLPRYKLLYEKLQDDISKQTLVSLFLSHIVNSNRLLWKHFKTVTPGVAPWEHIYFNPTIMSHNSGCEEVFVDCGAYDGAGAFNFIHHYSKEYKRMYLYEFDPISVVRTTEATNALQNIVIREVAVGSKSDVISAITNGTQGSRLEKYNKSTHLVQVVALDEDIKEPITFLKMDIEGAELDALKGSANHIKKECPKLAICVYHKREDAIDIAEYILSLNPKYKLFLRHEEHYMYCGTVLYAIP